MGLTSGGVGFIFLGCILFFDRGLLALGNVPFRIVVPVLIGFEAFIPDRLSDGHWTIQSYRIFCEAT